MNAEIKPLDRALDLLEMVHNELQGRVGDGSKLEAIWQARDCVKKGAAELDAFRTKRDSLRAQLRERDALLKIGLSAASASYAQAYAEHQGHERTAAKHDKIVMDWRRSVRVVLQEPRDD